MLAVVCALAAAGYATADTTPGSTDAAPTTTAATATGTTATGTTATGATATGATSTGTTPTSTTATAATSTATTATDTTSTGTTATTTTAATGPTSTAPTTGAATTGATTTGAATTTAAPALAPHLFAPALAPMTEGGSTQTAPPADPTYVVDTTADYPDALPGDGVCDDGQDSSTRCTLRAAVQEASADPAADTTIVLHSGDTYALTIPPQNGDGGDSGDLNFYAVTNTITVVSDGSTPATIDASSASFGDRAITIEPQAADVVIDGVDVVGGSAPFVNDSAQDGGAILNEGVLTLRGVSITGGSTQYPAGGGAIANESQAQLTLDHVSISGSSAGFGGGIANYGAVESVTDLTIDGTHADAGGAIENDGGQFGTSLGSVNGVAITNASALQTGGGIDNIASATFYATNLEIDGATLQDCECQTAGAGIYNEGPNGESSPSQMTLTNATISGSTADGGFGGGIANDGDLTATNLTVSGNSATATATTEAGPVPPGGGISNGPDASLNLLSSTIADNDGVGLASDSTVNVSFTIVAANHWNDGLYNCAGSGNASGDSNLEDVSGSGGPTCGFSLQVADAKLGPLADNGGAVKTMALLQGSPAIDGGAPSGCSTTDARGVTRIGPCDIGAYEYTGPRTLAVSIASPVNGRVTSSPSGIDCPGTCSADFANASTVTLSATGDSGYAFGSWSGDCTSTSGSTCSVTMDRARSVAASFVAAPTTSASTTTATTSTTTTTTTTSAPPAVTAAAAPVATADLGVSQSASSPAVQGTPVTFTVVVSNHGPSTATGVSVGEALPAQLAFGSSSGAGCSGTSCSIGSLASGASATVSFTATPTATGLLTATATASGSQLDANGANNVAATTIDVVLAPPPQGQPPTTPPPPPILPPPLPGFLVNAQPVTGIVLVDGVPLTAPDQIKVGSIVDVRGGSIQLVTQNDSAVFYGGVFKIVQGTNPNGVTTLFPQLTASQSVCTKTTARTTKGKRKPAMVARPKVLSLLWGSGKGHFRTQGHYSSATVRGTIWLTADRCDGTFTYVRQGEVAIYDISRRRTIILTAGHSYLARPHH